MMNTLGMIAIVIDDYDLAITHYVNTGSSLGLSYNYDNIPDSFNPKIFILDTEDLKESGEFDTYLNPTY